MGREVVAAMAKWAGPELGMVVYSSIGVENGGTLLTRNGIVFNNLQEILVLALG